MTEHIPTLIPAELLFKLGCLAVGGAVALVGWFVLWLSKEVSR